MMMNSEVLAIDLGSTRFKVAVFDRRLRRLRQGAAPVEHQFGPGGTVELRGDAVIRALASALAGASVPDAAPRIRAVVITSQAQTFSILDAAGTPRIPFISWQDSRSEAACAALGKNAALRDFRDHSSFSTIAPGLQIGHVRHLQDAYPGLIQSSDRVVLLPSYVAWMLTGIWAEDTNLAAMSGLFSLQGNDWWPAALHAIGITRDQLPSLVSPGAAAAVTARGALRFGIPAGVPVVMAGNDQTAGAYGAALETDGGVLLTLGTALVAYAVSPGLAAAEPGLIRGTYPGGRYYRMAADSCGGGIITWARSVLAGCHDDAAFMALAAEAQPGCKGLRFEAGLHETRGLWSQIGLQHGPGDFARSILEHLCERMALLLKIVENGPQRKALKVAGGGSEFALWRGILEQTLGRPLEKTSASPLEGAARMAWEATGESP